jgi:hypothetical protein
VLVNAQQANFVGATTGISTLSADGRSVLDSTGTAVSLYKPENGFTWMLFGGRHLNDFLSVQATYGWNHNELAITSVQVTAGVEHSLERSYTVRHHTASGELMLYFRRRSSAVRPYLSVGPGVAYLSGKESGTIFTRGSPVLPALRFSSTDLCLRVAVGIDIKVQRGVSFRYSFAETIQRNPISAQLSPAGKRGLANFQNLFGVAWRF